GANTYSGGTLIDGGTINFSNATSLGTGTVHLGVIGGGGGDASLYMTAGVTAANAISVEEGNGTLTLGSTFFNGTNTPTYSGAISLGADLTVSSVATATPGALTLSGAITGTSGSPVTLSLASGFATFSGIISDGPSTVAVRNS